jgi:hypothetical protein
MTSSGGSTCEEKITGMARTKKHHYVPVFYLNGFIDPDTHPYIWVYQKGSFEVLKLRPENCGFEKDYYSFVNPSGKRDSDTIEYAFSSLESGVAPIFEKINNEGFPDEKERVALSFFLACAMTRVPSFRNAIEASVAAVVGKFAMAMASNSEAWRAMLIRYEEETGEKINIPAEELQNFVLSGEYDLTTNPEVSLQMMVLAHDFAPVFYHMRWRFLKASEDFRFLTCDSPLYLCDPTHDHRSQFGVGLACKNAEISFPISREIALFASWNGREGFEEVRDQRVRDINQRTVISATRFVYSSQERRGIGRFVRRYEDFSPTLETFNIRTDKGRTILGMRYLPRARRKE